MQVTHSRTADAAKSPLPHVNDPVGVIKSVGPQVDCLHRTLLVSAAARAACFIAVAALRGCVPWWPAWRGVPCKDGRLSPQGCLPVAEQEGGHAVTLCTGGCAADALACISQPSILNPSHNEALQNSTKAVGAMWFFVAVQVQGYLKDVRASGSSATPAVNLSEIPPELNSITTGALTYESQPKESLSSLYHKH